MLKKVISGGQTGVDQAALYAAKHCGISTGGFLPSGCRTLDGPNYKLLSEFGMVEHSSSGYKERTWDNVLNSDGTLRIAVDFGSPGERCTLNAIREHNKPHFDVQLYAGPEYLVSKMLRWDATHSQVVEWIKLNDIRVLNVAGNSEKTKPGMYKTAYSFLIILFNNFIETAAAAGGEK